MKLSLPTAPQVVVPFVLTLLILTSVHVLNAFSILPLKMWLQYKTFGNFPDFWRLFTYPWVHESWTHLVLNQLALIMVFLLFAEQFKNFRLWLFALSCAPISALAIFYWQPQINLNTGFSAIIYGYLAAGGLSEVLCYRVKRSQQRLFIGIIVAGAVSIKATADLFLSTTNISTSSHFAGACFGILWGTLGCLSCWRTKNQLRNWLFF